MANKFQGGYYYVETEKSVCDVHTHARTHEHTLCFCSRSKLMTRLLLLLLLYHPSSTAVKYVSFVFYF